jgi:hypothetical protein
MKLLRLAALAHLTLKTSTNLDSPLSRAVCWPDFKFDAFFNVSKRNLKYG